MPNDKALSSEMQKALPSHPIMVVLVDDQPMVAESIRRMLEGEPDIDLHYCSEANKALDTIGKIQPTLILQDLIMPEIDGLDLIRQYRSHPLISDVPIIVLSAKEEGKTKAEAFSSGANDYIVKLPDKLELVARIRYHSQWYIHKLERDDAYRSLQESQRQLKNMNLTLLHLSTHDSLTNISNRYRFDQVFSDEWGRTGRDKIPLSLIMIDIDFFKNYNDALGHQTGDKCLSEVAGILSSGLRRPADMAARYGGEEFVILLPGADVKGALNIAENMRASVEALKIPHPNSSISAHVTISLGVAAIIPEHSKNRDGLLREADQALYDAKANGRNQIKVAEL